MEKIDEHGNYCVFPGVTVVSSICSDDYELFQKIYDCLAKNDSIKAYYRPLPMESYHVTFYDLYTKKRVMSDWRIFIAEKQSYFQKIRNVLQTNNFQPKLRFYDTYVSGVIMICLYLEDFQQLLSDSIAETINATGNKVGEFHMTLGYQYKSIPHEAARDIRDEIRRTMSSLLIDSEFVLNSPQLCYFNNMTAFIPWEENVPYPFD